jgi:hypothetical protein
MRYITPDEAMEWFVPAFLTLMLIILTAMVAAVFMDMSSATIQLNKSDWTCVEMRNTSTMELIPAGNNFVPTTSQKLICVNYIMNSSR